MKEYWICKRCGWYNSNKNASCYMCKKERTMGEFEYLYKCPKCDREHWGTLYYSPICIHDDNIGVEMRAVYHPAHHDEVSAQRVRREKQ